MAIGVLAPLALLARGSGDADPRRPGPQSKNRPNVVVVMTDDQTEEQMRRDAQRARA